MTAGIDEAPRDRRGEFVTVAEETASAIREHVWTGGMRKLFAAAPSSYLNCACQSGIAYWCEDGQHGRCARGKPLRQQETAVRMSDGMRPAIGASDVWLADRVCVWRCKCTCHASTPSRPAEPMSDEAAAWVRAVVWTKRMRKTFAGTPNFYLKCPCQYGPSGNCGSGKHATCWHGSNEPFLSSETYVSGPDGTSVLSFAEPFAHPTGSATKPQHMSAAMVWLADRACRWRCPCDCHTSSSAVPEPPPAAPEPRIDKPVQLDLFASLTA